MLIEKLKNELETYFKIYGHIDSSNVFEFEQEVLSLNFDNLTLKIDFAEVPYITSACIRVLIVCLKRLKKNKLVLLNLNDDIKEILDCVAFFENDVIVDYTISDSNIADKSYKSLLSRMVKNTPNRDIYHFNNNKYTWKDIDIGSQIIANDLEKIGVTKLSHVGLIATNSINWIYTFFAIQKLGAVVVLMNFNCKKEEIATLIDISDMEYICYGNITGFEDKKNFFEKDIFKQAKIKKTYDIEKVANLRDRFVEYDNIKNKFQNEVRADNPAVIIFTSGSTGKPKVVLLSTFNRMIATLVVTKINKIKADEKMCIYLPFFHQFSFMEVINTPLIKNIKIYFTENTKIENIIKTIQENKCTYFPTVPTLLVNMLNSKEISVDKVKSIKTIMLGGEPINENQIMEAKKVFVNAEFGITYGASEVLPITKTLYNDTMEHITKTVGKPTEGVKLKIVNYQTGEKCKLGEIGEVLVKSETAMIGYYKIDIKQQAFDDEGYIKTGDLGYIDDDGYLRLTGRCKELIIRAGENISPNEIAENILKYEDIAGVKVLGVPDKEYGEAVVAAIIMKKNIEFDENKLNDFLSDKISKYKIPKYYVVYKNFPVLANNKLDGVRLKKEIIEKLGIQ